MTNNTNDAKFKEIIDFIQSKLDEIKAKPKIASKLEALKQEFNVLVFKETKALKNGNVVVRYKSPGHKQRNVTYRIDELEKPDPDYGIGTYRIESTYELQTVVENEIKKLLSHDKFLLFRNMFSHNSETYYGKELNEKMLSFVKDAKERAIIISRRENLVQKEQNKKFARWRESSLKEVRRHLKDAISYGASKEEVQNLVEEEFIASLMDS